MMWFGTLVVLAIMFVLAAKRNPGMWSAALPVKQSQDAYYHPEGQEWHGHDQVPGYGQPQQYGQAELHGQHQPYSHAELHGQNQQAELYDPHTGAYQLPGSPEQKQHHELMGSAHTRGGQWGPPAELGQPVYEK